MTEKKIAGMHVCEDGTIGLVWLSYDSEVDYITVYDTAIFKREVPIVIAESINARGNIPIAWVNKEMSDHLLNRGCRMLYEPVDDSDAMAEVQTREIWERMRTKRIAVKKRLKDWFDESKSFDRDKNKIPRDSHPLMAATRYAVASVKSARSLTPKYKQAKQKRSVAII